MSVYNVHSYMDHTLSIGKVSTGMCQLEKKNKTIDVFDLSAHTKLAVYQWTDFCLTLKSATSTERRNEF